MRKEAMTPQPPQFKNAKRNAIIVTGICLALAIPAAIYLIFFSFEPDNIISNHGRIAVTLGVIFAFLSSFLFMGIIFFSARSGADEQPDYVKLAQKDRQNKMSGK